MPGLLQRSAQFGHVTAINCSAFSNSAGSLPVSNAIWSRQQEDVSFDQLRKFWCELPTQKRKDLLRIDKQAICEQTRKNLYCSRCHGLLLECYSQIVMHGKSLQQDYMDGFFPQKTTAEVLADNEIENLQDPSMHPWGGLAITKDGMLTLLDCFICANSPDVIHKVFSSARQREHDRELLYPDACGGGGRGWISHGLANYGRAHGIRETCALHSSRLSCDTLLDFWSALGDETRSSLLNMKEDDFIERLIYRFDSKRFCRDCRRNVLREFKELRELKRLKKELRCTSWFCVADSAIHYEVSEDSVLVDWQQSFTDTSTYHHFEWAIGTAEGKSDILDFQNAGMKGKAELKGLDLSSFSACFITLRAWKIDGRFTELSVKAHALKGQACVHQRLIAGDGVVTITKGDSIKCFFEHAEEVEEEEDDELIDRDGIELDGDVSRPQKHAKSPELAREFLLDAATVIFKEQVEKAFREGTARQNSHSLFISLAINLLEDCVHVACKEIITLKKQIKLLEEEENDKHEEEERRERKKNKEREKKLRRKERLKEKEKDKEIKLIDEKQPCSNILSSQSNLFRSTNNDESLASTCNSPLGNSEAILEPNFTNMTVNKLGVSACRHGYREGMHAVEDNDSFLLEPLKFSMRNLPFKRFAYQDQSPKWYDKHRSAFCNVMSNQESSMNLKASSRLFSGGPGPFKERIGPLDSRNCINGRINEKFRSSHSRNNNTYNSLSCRNNLPIELKLMDRHHISTARGGREVNSAGIADSIGILPRQLSHSHGCYTPENCKVPKGRLVTCTSGRDPNHMRQVWEPMGVRKKCIQGNLDADLTSDTTAQTHLTKEITSDKDENTSRYNHKPSTKYSLPEISIKFREIDLPSFKENKMDMCKDLNECLPSEKPLCNSKDIAHEGCCQSSSSISTSSSYHSMTTSSSSESCSSCPSEGDSGTSFSTTLNTETLSTSDSEDSCSKSQNSLPESKLGFRGDASQQTTTLGPPLQFNFPSEDPKKVDFNCISPRHELPLPSFPSEFISFESQNTKSWSGTPVIGILPFSQHSHCMLPPPVGYNLHAYRSSVFAMQHNTLLPITSAALNLEQHHSFSAIIKKHLKNGYAYRDVQASETKEHLLNEEIERNAAELNETNKAFSLFHFGSPLVGATAHPGPTFKSAESQDNVPCSMEESKMEEYSLFAAKNSSRFLFSL